MRNLQFILITIAITLTSCISEQSVVQKNYTIEWPDLSTMTSIESTSTIRGNCEIESVKINALYDRNQIVNRSDSHEITFYKYHKWAVRPSVLITELLKNYMEKKQVFQSVSSRYSKVIPEYRLVTQVTKLEVVEDKNLLSAHVQMEFRIVNNNDNRILVSHSLDRKESLTDRDLNLFAHTVSSLIFNELDVFTQLIQEELTGQKI